MESEDALGNLDPVMSLYLWLSLLMIEKECSSRFSFILIIFLKLQLNLYCPDQVQGFIKWINDQYNGLFSFLIIYITPMSSNYAFAYPRPHSTSFKLLSDSTVGYIDDSIFYKLDLNTGKA